MTCCHKEGYNAPVCGAKCCMTEETQWMPQSGEHFGIQQFSCYECNKIFCEEHGDDVTPHVCEDCEKVACMECHQTAICDSCYKTTCWKCSRISFCHECERDIYDDCSHVFHCDVCDEMRCEECMPFLFCESKDCRKGNCMDCEDNDDDLCVTRCDACEVSFCSEHLLFEISTRGEESCCMSCIERALSLIVAKNLELRRDCVLGKTCTVMMRNSSLMCTAKTSRNSWKNKRGWKSGGATYAANQHRSKGRKCHVSTGCS